MTVSIDNLGAEGVEDGRRHPEFANVHRGGLTVTVRSRDVWRWQAKGWSLGVGSDRQKTRGALKRMRRRQGRDGDRRPVVRI